MASPSTSQPITAAIGSDDCCSRTATAKPDLRMAISSRPVAATWLIAKLVAKTVGLRPTEEEEAQGLDIADHGEEGYQHN